MTQTRQDLSSNKNEVTRKSLGAEKIDWGYDDQSKFLMCLPEREELCTTSKANYKKFAFKTEDEAKAFIGSLTDKDIKKLASPRRRQDLNNILHKSCKILAVLVFAAITINIFLVI